MPPVGLHPRGRYPGGVASQITLERSDERPAWQVRVGGELVGVVFRQRGEYRALQEGTSAPLPSRFTSREAAARALARRAGHQGFDPNVTELKPRRR